jgi:hypothetical protein
MSGIRIRFTCSMFTPLQVDLALQTTTPLPVSNLSGACSTLVHSSRSSPSHMLSFSVLTASFLRLVSALFIPSSSLRDSTKRRGMLVDPASLEALSAVCDAGAQPLLSLLHACDCPGNERCEVAACAAAAERAKRRHCLMLNKPCKVTKEEM